MYSSDFIYLSHPFSSLPSLYKKLTKRPYFFSCIWLPMCASFPTLSQQFFKGRLTFPYGYHTFISSATFHINIEMFKLSISQIFLSCPRSNVGQISHSFMEKFERRKNALGGVLAIQQVPRVCSTFARGSLE
jgi:hypothetical protein